MQNKEKEGLQNRIVATHSMTTSLGAVRDAHDAPGAHDFHNLGLVRAYMRNGKERKQT